MHKNVQVMSFKNYENNSKIVKVMIKNRVVPFYLEHGVHCTSKNNTLVLGITLADVDRFSQFFFSWT